MVLIDGRGVQTAGVIGF